MGAPRYEILRKLQTGGMAELFEAKTLGSAGFARRIALKRLLPEHCSDPEMVEDFLDEARVLSELHHANIVTVFDSGEIDGAPFQALELIDGLDLSAVLERSSQLGSEIVESIAIHIAVEVSRALEYAHEARDSEGRALEIVHRDVSPENILASFEGDVKLADFGIARTSQRQRQTRIGVVKGKLEWMAPEQHRGERIDHRADLFSLGLVLLKLVTGSQPFELERLRKIALASQSMPRLDVAEDIDAVLQRALAFDPRRRFESAAELRKQLLKLLAAREDLDPKDSLRAWLGRLRSGPRPRARNPLSALFQVPESEELAAPRIAEVAESPAAETESRVGTLVAATQLEPARRLDTQATAISMGTSAESSQTDPEFAPDPKLRTENRPNQLEPTTGFESLGPYLLRESLGRGGFGEVFRAIHSTSGGEVAVKILHAPLTHRRAHERFRREIQALQSLRDVGIVRVLDHGLAADGRTYLVMELLQGQTLANLIESHGTLSLDRAGAIAGELLRILESVHRAGITHRDLSPTNVMILGSGAVKILDFGIAIHSDAELTRLTKSGDLVGTMRFMSPEQLLDPEKVGPPADIYCVGLMLICMVDGFDSFRGPAREVAQDRLRDGVHVGASLGPLRDLVKSLVDPDPLRRPGASQARAELRRVLRTPVSIRLLVGVLLVLTILTISLATALLVRSSRARLGEAIEMDASVPSEPVVAVAVQAAVLDGGLEAEFDGGLSAGLDGGSILVERVVPASETSDKQLGRGVESRTRRPGGKTSPPGPSLKSEAERQLRQRGLEMQDLAALPSLARTQRAVRSALEAGDVRALEEAFGQLNREEIDFDVLAEERLRSTFSRLSRAAEGAQKNQLQELERDYLDARALLVKPMGPAEFRKVATAARALEEKLRALDPSEE